MEAYDPKPETPPSSANVKYLEKIYNVWADQSEQKGVMALPLNEFPWLFHGSIVIQKIIAKFYNKKLYIKFLDIYNGSGGVSSNFSHFAGYWKHWKYVENKVKSREMIYILLT